MLDTSVGESPPILLPPLWDDRRQAGRALAARLRDLGPDTLLLALPRGGVAVAAVMADQLALPLATWCVRKVADPANPELAIGAVAPGDVTVWRNGASASRHEAAARRGGWLQAQRRELARRGELFGDPDPASLLGRPLVVVDDGVATGMTLQAALVSLRRCGPASLQLAVPVADRQVLAALAALVDRTTVLAAVADLQAVGLWYRHFEQLTDAEVLDLLAEARRR
ncbi:MAG: phosphoribosyltransferase [Cyanobium sp. M30B3]|nr:MAG: phosphoribosyltransferase [Cyanobium sp. M30B3]